KRLCGLEVHSRFFVFSAPPRLRVSAVKEKSTFSRHDGHGRHGGWTVFSKPETMHLRRNKMLSANFSTAPAHPASREALSFFLSNARRPQRLISPSVKRESIPSRTIPAGLIRPIRPTNPNHAHTYSARPASVKPEACARGLTESPAGQVV